MDKFYENFKFFIAFMVFVLFFNMLFGEKPTQYFLILVLLSMAIKNYKVVSNLIQDMTHAKTQIKTETETETEKPQFKNDDIFII